MPLNDSFSPRTPPPPPKVSGFADIPRASATLEEYLQTKKVKSGTKRFTADNKLVLGILLALVALLGAAAFYVSFNGLYSAGAWAVGESPPLQFAVPIMLDLAIIGFTLALFIERERGEKVRGTRAAILIFATISSITNVLHTLTVTTAETTPQLVVGCVISGGAPFLLAFATEKIAVKVFQNPKATNE